MLPVLSLMSVITEHEIAEVISKLQKYIAKTMTPEELFYNTTNVTNPEHLAFIEKRNKYETV